MVTHSDVPTHTPSDYVAPQVIHAAMEFAYKFPIEWKQWYETSNSIIVLSVANEQELYKFCNKLKAKNFKYVEFKEPDVANELTAIAIVPGPSVRKICSGLPLAGKKVNEGAASRLNKKFEVIAAMSKEEQCEGQTILEHCKSVRDYFFDLIEVLNGNIGKYEWCLPTWCVKYSKQLLTNLPADYILEKYLLWHDCGKPFCKVIDENGKTHFPDHAKVSAKLFQELYPEQLEVSYLIENDMRFHLLKTEEVEEFCKLPYASVLMLASIASLHSNGKMFGGFQSQSFKIKWKRMNRNGNEICKIMFDI